MDTNTMSMEMQDLFRNEGHSNPINPLHYGKDEAHDCITYCLQNGVGFLEGNVIKYVTRWRKKNGIEDLKKAQEYLRRLIESEEERNA